MVTKLLKRSIKYSYKTYYNEKKRGKTPKKLYNEMISLRNWKVSNKATSETVTSRKRRWIMTEY